MLAGRTRVLVTHQTQFLPLADHVIVVDGGRVTSQGTYAQLVAEKAIVRLSASDPFALPSASASTAGSQCASAGGAALLELLAQNPNVQKVAADRDAEMAACMAAMRARK